MGAEVAQRPLFIQFAREPVAGAVKTRLLPALTPEQACDLHSELVLWTSRTLCAAAVAEVELSVAGNVLHPLFRECQDLGVAAVRPQSSGCLGTRMYRALQSGLQCSQKVLLVGSDCPQIDKQYLLAALAALDECEVVLGPAADGGYVLIGVRELYWRWFEGIAWGSDSVYGATLARLDETATSWQALSVLRDIDRPEDLPLWRSVAAGRP